MKQNLKVAVVQAGSKIFDLESTLERFEQLALQAARSDAELAVFPEAFIGGYPKGLDFGARVGQRSEAGRDLFARYYRQSIDVPGPETERIGEIARSCRMQLVLGAIERERGTLYCSVLYFAADGNLVGKHRKVMPTAMERLIWGFGDGSTLGIVETSLGRVGAAICWENYMPQLRLSMYSQGVELYCAPTVDDRESWQPSMRHIAMEGRCFVLAACQYMTAADCPEDYPLERERFPSGTLIRGGSVIVDPFGEVLAGPIYDREDILVAELDADSIIRGKFDLDVAGHYSCPEIFQLKINHKDLLSRK
ncbi:MAG: carbon-nitrogen hydrolase family protein [Wenzhouxiangellaceae bacterium]|nr:carbon-nitrogen hydrolase family protein [Wenzhouxiangellaceae bacterium]